MKRCDLCPLHQYSNISKIPGEFVGKEKNNTVMVINSTASDLDDRNGEATPSQVLIDRLAKVGVTEFYYTNAMKCRCPKGTKISVSMQNKCQSHLTDEIEKVNPKYVLLIGAQACKMAIGKSIMDFNAAEMEYNGRMYMGAINPSIIFHDPGKEPLVDQAFQNFGEMITGTKRGLPDLNIFMVENIRQLRKSFDILKTDGRIVYDIETTGLNRFTDVINLIGYGNRKHQFVIPVNALFSPLRHQWIAQTKLMQEWVKLMNDSECRLIGANIKFDDLFLYVKCGDHPIPDGDTVLQSHACNENTPNGVKINAQMECNAVDWDVDKDLKVGKYKTPEKYVEYIQYLGCDIYYEDWLDEIFMERLNEDYSMRMIYEHVAMNASHMYTKGGKVGCPVNVKQFKKVEKYLNDQIEEIEDELSEWKEGVNWASPVQVAKFLYDDLKLTPPSYTESGNPSTGESALKQLYDDHESIEWILKHRALSIQKSHFIDGWKKWMHNGKIYPNFKIHGTVTGRTSSTDPNLQQVPRDKTIRNLIYAPKGKTFVEMDFSQAELRIVAMLSEDPEMMSIYRDGGDIHSKTYEIVSGEPVSYDKYERKEQRKKAKAVNFGYVYGMYPKKFQMYARDSYEVKMTLEEATESRNAFFRTYSNLPAWHDKQRRIVKQLGYVRSPIGRKRRLPDIYSSDKGKVMEAERQAINSPVQGFGSDLTLLGACEVVGVSHYYNKEWVLDQSKFDLIGTVHDASLFLVDDDYLMEFLPKCKKILESPKTLKKVFEFEPSIPMVVDATVGNAWGDGMELEIGEDGEWLKEINTYLNQKEK